MLPGGSDPLYRRILAAGHIRYTRIEVWSGQGVRLDDTLPVLLRNTWLGEGENPGLVFMDGAVTANLNSRVARSLSLTVPSYMYPVEPTDLLAPFGNEIRAFSGVLLGDGSLGYTWQVFRGRIRDVELSSDGTCTLLCADRAADVADVNFVSPQNSVPGNPVSTEWQRLITEAVPDATFGTSDLFSKAVEPLTWEFDLPSALDEMARSVSAVWYPLANGDFVIRRYPWTVNSPSLVQWSSEEGGDVGSWRARRSRDTMFNVVTVTGERLNGDAPVFATASDTTPGSPTQVGGNFGTRSRLERLQTPSSQGGAQGTAEELLRTYITPIEEWTLDVAPDSALELGDTGTVMVEGRSVRQVVMGFQLPLGLSGSMTISTRSIVVGDA